MCHDECHCYCGPAIPGFFFSAWITMIFEGIVASDLGVKTISYPTAMVVTIALWLVVAPFLFFARKRGDKYSWSCRVDKDTTPPKVS